MWWLFQGLIMTLIIGSNAAYHWARQDSGFAVMVLLAAFAASWSSVWLNDLLLWVRRKPPAANSRKAAGEWLVAAQHLALPVDEVHARAS
jgi:hypothetical protein